MRPKFQIKKQAAAHIGSLFREWYYVLSGVCSPEVVLCHLVRSGRTSFRLRIILSSPTNSIQIFNVYSMQTVRAARGRVLNQWEGTRSQSTFPDYGR